jgi:hypothetical protein
MSKVTDSPVQGSIGTTLQPKRYDITLYQGDTFRFNLVLNNASVPVNITGWTALAQIKKAADNTPGETPTMTCTVGTTDGKVSVVISGTGTAALQGATEYMYDIQLTDTAAPTANVRTFIGGKITVTEDISE